MASAMLSSNILRKQLCTQEFRKADKSSKGRLMTAEVDTATQRLAELLCVGPFSDEVLKQARERSGLWTFSGDEPLTMHALEAWQLSVVLDEAQFQSYFELCLQAFRGDDKIIEKVKLSEDSSTWTPGSTTRGNLSEVGEPEAEAAPEASAAQQASFLWAFVGYGWVWGSWTDDNAASHQKGEHAMCIACR